MARRNDIDWEAIEKDYRAGRLSVVAVAAHHGVSRTQLNAKAKKEGWTRDLSAAIEQRTQEKIAVIDVAALIEKSATESANQSAKTIQSAIEQASDVAAGIVIKHRAGLRLDMDRAEVVSGLLEDALAEADGIKNIVSVTQAMKNLSDIRCKLRDQERVIYGLDKDRPADTGLSRESIDVLKRMKAELDAD